MRRFERKKHKKAEIEPDEILLDAHNLPQFDEDQYEGRLERPISDTAVFFLGGTFLILALIFLARASYLQVVHADLYEARAENNRLVHIPIFPERGVIFDRNGEELAWNEAGEEVFSLRAYTQRTGFSHILGYVSYPKKDANNFYFQERIEPQDGIELQYQDVLGGRIGIQITEVDVRNVIQSESVYIQPQDGSSVHLSIDARIQEKLAEEIAALSEEVGFDGGAGVIVDVHSGQILALVSMPEYDSEILSLGKSEEEVERFVYDERKPFLNRAISGLYTPGSTVKPFFALGALNEHIIDPAKEILSTGSISISNPFVSGAESVFNDWKAHGWVDMRKALAVSSNVYFYVIGGGYEDQEGLGIERLESYAHLFGLGEKTGIDLPGEVNGIIPNPVWKAQHFDGDSWRIGDTYNTAIGQYGFQITPLQLARSVAAVANNGKMIKPHLLSRIDDSSITLEHTIQRMVDVDVQDFAIVREGMRMGVENGTAKGLYFPNLAVAAKSGTAEVGISKKRVNSWISGFFPYENPRYAFAVVMEKGPSDNLIGAAYVMNRVLSWMQRETPEYTNQQTQ